MAHIHEKIDFTASVFIVYKNKVLLHKHKVSGKWFQPGGHIELDEDPNEAAVREVKEETGLTITLIGESKKYNSPYEAQQLVAPRFLNKHYYATDRTHQHVDMCFLARATTDDARPEEPGGEVRWFTKEELLDENLDLLEDVRECSLRALEEMAS